jgi:hypothetical protein
MAGILPSDLLRFDFHSLFANIQNKLILLVVDFSSRNPFNLLFFNRQKENKMKKYACLLLLGPVLSISASALAGNRAVNISIGSIGGALDEAAVQTVRQIVGHAVASQTVDKFVVNGPGIVNSPRIGLPIPVEENLSMCAEAGASTVDAEFDAFIEQLHSVSPKEGTFYNIEPSASCGTNDSGNDSGDNGDVFCTMDAKICPDDSYVSRQPPSCEFAPCPKRVK